MLYVGHDLTDQFGEGGTVAIAEEGEGVFLDEGGPVCGGGVECVEEGLLDSFVSVSAMVLNAEEKEWVLSRGELNYLRSWEIRIGVLIDLCVLVDMTFFKQDTVDLRPQIRILSRRRIGACGLGDADGSCRVGTHGDG